MQRASFRQSSIRGSAGFVGAGMAGGGMGDWLSDMFNPSTWNWNPTYSPTFQAVAQPVLDVAGAVAGVATTGVPIPAGSLLNTLLGGGTAKAPTPAQPYSPVYSAPAPAAAPAPTATATGSKDNTMLWIGGGLLLAGLGYMALKPKPHARA